MGDDVFCKIIKKEIPAKIRFENEQFMAIEDINPKAPVHILIFPKVHQITSVNDLSSENSTVIGEMALIAQQLAKENSIDQSGYRIVVNSGDDAGQTVKHVHMHLMGGERLSE